MPRSSGLVARRFDLVGVHRAVGVGYGRLLQSYGVHRTIRAAHSRGLRTTRRTEADGSILLTLEGGSL